LLLNNKKNYFVKEATCFLQVAFFIFSFRTDVYSQSVIKPFLSLSCSEKQWVIFHPFIARNVYNISLEAEKKATQLKTDSIIKGDMNGGCPDAFRHAYWMAVITQKFGWRAAYQLGKAHEKGNFRNFKKHRTEEGALPDAISVQMDYLNNDVGIETGKNYPLAGSNELCEIIIDALKNGKLYIIKKDGNGNFLRCNGEIIPPFEFNGCWDTPKCIVQSE
jgi:hypothetical protein